MLICELGCPETVPFVDEGQEVAHEEVCEYRLQDCPILDPAHCDWRGTKAVMLDHCRDQHQDSVVENPCSFNHDISESSQRKYILTAFELLFILHTKVCVAAGKIYHSVRFLGTPEEAADFFFDMVVKRNDQAVIRKGLVAPQDSLEDTSEYVSFNNLLENLGDLDDITFTVTVNRRERDEVDQLAMDAVACADCGTDVTVFRYRKEDGWRCDHCTLEDIDKKCSKHEFYYCQQRTQCYLCRARVPRGELSVHYGSTHRGLSVRSGDRWRADRAPRGRGRLVNCVAGTAVCKYTLSPERFRLNVHIPATSERLREFRCEVQLTNPTGYTETFRPDAQYDVVHDWRIEVNPEENPTLWDDVLDVTVVIQ